VTVNPYNGFSPSLRAKSGVWLKKEYDAGRRTRPVKCQVCGQTEGVIEAHAEDYSEPFGDNIDQYSLCYRCHIILHCRPKCPDAFARYAATLAAGFRFAPLATRNFPRFSADHLRASGRPEKIRADGPLPGFAEILAHGARMRELNGVEDPPRPPKQPSLF